MSGTVRQFVDFTNAATADTGENNSTSITPISDGESANQTVLRRPSESLRQRAEAIRNVMVDTLYLRDADRNLLIAGPGTVTWPGSTTAAASGIPTLSDVLYVLPMLSPGSAQTAPVPPVASAFGSLHLQRSSDSMNSILVTSRRRSYAAGDQINVTVTSGASFSCVLDAESGYERTINVTAVSGTTTLNDVITALNGLLPGAPDNTQLVTAVLEGGALGTDLLLTPQAKQYVSGNYDGEGHAITPANLASFFASNPTQALAEGDTLCVSYAMVSDTASTGGRRQSLPENSNTAIPAASFFNSRVHPENLTNALPICKVVNDRLVFATGAEVPAGATSVSLTSTAATDVTYGGGGNWADGTTNPATSVESQLDKIITDLAGATGTGKVQGSAVGSDLAAATLASQISSLVTGWLKLNRANAVTALQSFNGADDQSFGWGVDTPPNNATGRPKPIWYAVLDAGAGIKLRAYSTKKSGVMFTVNANVTGMSGSLVTYARDAAAWTDTSNADAVRFTLDAGGKLRFDSFAAHGSATWDDSSWVSLGLMDSVGFQAPALYYTTEVQLTLHPGSSWDARGSTFGTLQSFSRDGWSFTQAGVTPVYYAIQGLRAGDVITGWGSALTKHTGVGNAVTGRLMESLITGDILLGSGTSISSAAGTYNLSESGLSISVGAGTSYYLRFTPSGVNTPSADAIDSVYVTVKRPHP